MLWTTCGGGPPVGVNFLYFPSFPLSRGLVPLCRGFFTQRRGFEVYSTVDFFTCVFSLVLPPPRGGMQWLLSRFVMLGVLPARCGCRVGHLSQDSHIQKSTRPLSVPLYIQSVPVIGVCNIMFIYCFYFGYVISPGPLSTQLCSYFHRCPLSIDVLIYFEVNVAYCVQYIALINISVVSPLLIYSFSFKN